MNKCEKEGLVHAWQKNHKMWGYDTVRYEVCANCGLERTYYSETKEWWSYTDGRPDEPIINILII